MATRKRGKRIDKRGIKINGVVYTFETRMIEGGSNGTVFSVDCDALDISIHDSDIDSAKAEALRVAKERTQVEWEVWVRITFSSDYGRDFDVCGEDEDWMEEACSILGKTLRIGFDAEFYVIGKQGEKDVYMRIPNSSVTADGTWNGIRSSHTSVMAGKPDTLHKKVTKAFMRVTPEIIRRLMQLREGFRTLSSKLHSFLSPDKAEANLLAGMPKMLTEDTCGKRSAKKRR